jgi:hypothetical protein
VSANDDVWMMRPGEKAALDGVIATVRPSVSIEIGCHRGGSLEAISAGSDLVHAFDLDRHPDLTTARFPNVTFHFGESRALLPPVLDALSTHGSNVDFALIDGDHSVEGVRRDLLDLLESPCVGNTVILLHDTLSEQVRAGLEGIDLSKHEKVKYADFDFVPGVVNREGRFADNQSWGLGIVITGWEIGETWPSSYAAHTVYRAFAESEAASKLGVHVDQPRLLAFDRDLAIQQRLVADLRRTWSWRLTKPLRMASAAASRMRARVFRR